MKLIDNSLKTNWKLIAIVVALGLVVGGAILWYANLPTPAPQPIEIPNIKKPTPQQTVDTSTSSTSLTAGWQTYRNEEFGFEFQYPADRELGYLSVEGAYLGSLSAAEARNINTLIVGSKGGVHIIDILADVNNVSIHREPTEVTLNGVSYKKYEMAGLNNRTIYVTTHNNKQFWIEVQSLDLADQILSTFRFIK